MIVELIATGTEIVRGRSLDSNSPAVARRLTRLGHEVRYFSTIRDDLADLTDGIRRALTRAELVILTGGLGPTEDDLTRHAAAAATRRRLRFIKAEWKRLRARAASFKRRLTPNNKRQALFPSGAEILPNRVGSASGFVMQLPRSRFVALPGPPREMEAVLDVFLLALPPPPSALAEKAFKIFGIAESRVEHEALPDLRRIPGLEYGITAKGGTISLNLRVPSDADVDAVRALLRRTFGAAFFGEDESTIAGATAALLLSNNATLAVAESCTGGLIGHLLTDIPGISDSLLESVVTYSNASKMRRLGVRAATLDRHGAVSRQTACEMAIGARRISRAHLAVAVTGVAGPTGGSARKPVGLVYCALADETGARAERRVFPGTRQDIKERAAEFALDLVRRRLLRRKE